MFGADIHTEGQPLRQPGATNHRRFFLYQLHLLRRSGCNAHALDPAIG
jgi:hypothetical protein